MTSPFGHSAVAEREDANVTVPSDESARHAELWTFPGEQAVSEPNRRNADETQLYRGNGTSNALRIDLGQRLLAPPPLEASRKFFRAIQKWQGYVIDLGEDKFTARLVPIVGEGPDQEAEIYVEEIDRDDRALIEPGAVFYWSIGYLDGPSGRLRASVIRFRRLPVWTGLELQNAEAEAAKLRGLLDAQ